MSAPRGGLRYPVLPDLAWREMKLPRETPGVVALNDAPSRAERRERRTPSWRRGRDADKNRRRVRVEVKEPNVTGKERYKYPLPLGSGYAEPLRFRGEETSWFIFWIPEKCPFVPFSVVVQGKEPSARHSRHPGRFAWGGIRGSLAWSLKNVHCHLAL